MNFNTFTLSNRTQEIEKLEKVAQDFINANRDELIKAIHRYADVDKISDKQLAEYARDQQIFFLSGQTIANIFTENRDNTFMCYDYRDLDVFILTANSISYDLKLEVNEEK